MEKKSSKKQRVLLLQEGTRILLSERDAKAVKTKLLKCSQFIKHKNQILNIKKIVALFDLSTFEEPILSLWRAKLSYSWASFKKEIKSKLKKGIPLTNYDKGENDKGSVVADYPVLRDISNDKTIDQNGDLQSLKFLQKELKNRNIKSEIKYLPKRKLAYEEGLKELKDESPH